MVEMRVETMPLDQLHPAIYNPRKDLKPGDKEYALIKKSLETHGYHSPIVWNEVTGNIVGGHQRLKILKADGVKEADVVVVHLEDDISEQEMNLLLNKARGRRDIPKLADLLEGLQLASYDMGATGLDAPTIDEIMSQAHSKDIREDEFNPEEETELIAQPGDLWELGKHRLLCGSGLSEPDVERLMDSTMANLIICRPQIGDDPEELVSQMYDNVSGFLTSGGSVYVFHQDQYGDLFRLGFKSAGLHLSGVCVWEKEEETGTQPYHVQHEPVLFGWSSGTHRWLGGRNRTTVWSWPNVTRDKAGLEIMPISIAAFPIRNSSAANGIVLDLFGQHGSVLIACEQTNRIYRGTENSPEYASMIIKRYMKFCPNKKITVERDGKTVTVQEGR